jgi:hypothetical protein
MRNLSRNILTWLEGIISFSIIGTSGKVGDSIVIFQGYPFECEFFWKESRNFGSGLCWFHKGSTLNKECSYSICIWTVWTQRKGTTFILYEYANHYFVHDNIKLQSFLARFRFLSMLMMNCDLCFHFILL